jgi:hypothetical protein
MVDLSAPDTTKSVKSGVKMGLTFGVKGILLKNKDSVTVPGETSDVRVKSAEGIALSVHAGMADPSFVSIFKADVKNGARVICKTKGRFGQIDQIEGNRVPVKVTRDNQDFRVEPQQALEPGQYALLIDRTVRATWTFDVE